jgi:hypothetical protein
MADSYEVLILVTDTDWSQLINVVVSFFLGKGVAITLLSETELGFYL